METDILIAGLMALASVVAALGLVMKVARTLREGPAAQKRQKAKAPRTAPVLRPTSGW
jgi:hypothetical protein